MNWSLIALKWLMIRWMCGVKLNERKKSEELRELLGLDPVSLMIKKSRLRMRWFPKFSNPVYLTTPQREFPLQFCNGSKTRVMTLLDGGKPLTIYAFFKTQYQKVTDGRIDGQNCQNNKNWQKFFSGLLYFCTPCRHWSHNLLPIRNNNVTITKATVHKNYSLQVQL